MAFDHLFPEVTDFESLETKPNQAILAAITRKYYSSRSSDDLSIAMGLAILPLVIRNRGNKQL